MDNEMTEKERADFEVRLQTDTDLQEALVLEKTLLQLGASAAQKMKKFSFKEAPDKNSSIWNFIEQVRENWQDEKIKDVVAEEETGNIVPLKNQPFKIKNNKIRLIKIWKTLALTAAVLATVVIGSWYFLNITHNASIVNKGTKPDTPNQRVINGIPPVSDIKKNKPQQRLDGSLREQLFAENFSVDHLPKNTDGLLADAFTSYKKGDYKKASQQFEVAVTEINNFTLRAQENQKDADEKKLLIFYAHYYKALSYMANDKDTLGITEFNSISYTPGKYWQSKINWYLALAYLKTGQIAKAETLLDQLANTNQALDYKQKSKKLINEIKEHQ